MSDENKVRYTAEAVKGIVEAIPVYQDVAQPAAKEIGTALQTVAKTINVALAPVSALIWGYEKIRDYLNDRLSEKLKYVPQEHIVTPNPSVAGPAIEALRFVAHEPSLREMYVNLLASSMDEMTSSKAHPGFIEIIKQMSPEESLIVDYMSGLGASYLPFLAGNIWVNASVENSTFTSGWSIPHFSLIEERAGSVYPGQISVSLDNLRRLGLIETMSYAEFKTIHPLNPLNYKVLEGHPQFINKKLEELEERIKEDHNVKSVEWRITKELEKKVVALTALGFQFCEACVIEKSANRFEQEEERARAQEFFDQFEASKQESARVFKSRKKKPGKSTTQ